MFVFNFSDQKRRGQVNDTKLVRPATPLDIVTYSVYP